MATSSGGQRIFSGSNEGSSKVIDKCLHSIHVVCNILIVSFCSIYQLEAHLFFVFSFFFLFLILFWKEQEYLLPILSKLAKKKFAFVSLLQQWNMRSVQLVLSYLRGELVSIHPQSMTSYWFDRLLFIQRGKFELCLRGFCNKLISYEE